MVRKPTMVTNSAMTTVDAATRRGQRRRSSHATAGSRPTATMMAMRTRVRMYQMRVRTETSATAAMIFSSVDQEISSERRRSLSAIRALMSVQAARRVRLAWRRRSAEPGLPARLQGPPERAADGDAAEQHLEDARDEIRIDRECDTGRHVGPAMLLLAVHEKDKADAAWDERQHEQRRVEIEVHAAMLPRSLMYRLGCVTEVMRGVDERDVRERLREVADLAAAARVVLLGQQADVVAQREDPLEQRARLVDAPEQHVRVGEPEAARDEHPFARRQAVLGFTGAVPDDEAVAQQLALDCLDGLFHPRIRRGKKTG